MIADHIGNFELYKGITERVNRAVQYIQNHDFAGLQTGTHEVEGDEIFFNLIEYVTKDQEERFWESHKKYLDLHYILEGSEFIAREQFDKMTVTKEYDEQDDYYLLEGKVQSKVKLEQGDFMLLFPDDVHMTGIKVDDPEKVRKVVFKILI
ncbi:YhcH/YjgK/YiaL family protein [Neobacillus niacini]|uniref:YhcH/YjgK/YiaL family protein n=1 Tax=Neobacillus niacini TaxID=86668 RepID=UPI0021CB4E44|nr:YhcH/YjgK/YiaL family protein [Neobacillus niacini]MCM3765106.1 YhcH/YjgK/YiaL family protein [Neobacillus niacini]